MYSLLVKLFIKNKDDIKNEKVREKYGLLASCFGIISNAIVCTLKIIVGMLTATISILADGINNLADALSSVVSLIGFKLSGKKPDKEHPYGHQRMEYIAAFIVSIIIVILGLKLIVDSYEAIGEPATDKSKFIINVIVLAVAILVKLYQALFNYKIGKKINSQAILATATDSRNDVIATSVVLIGLVVSYFVNYNLDGYLGMVVGGFITFSGFKLVFETTSPLLGEAADPELVKQFKALVEENSVVLGIHDLEIHSYGPSKMFATCHVEVDSRGDLYMLHDEIDRIEHRCRDELGIQTTLHLDPILVDDPITNELKEMVMELLEKNIPFKWAIHDFRVVTGPTHTNLIFDIVVPFDIKEDDDEVIELVSSIINSNNPQLFAVVEVDRDLTNIL